jgi:hypothetical protein
MRTAAAGAVFWAPLPVHCLIGPALDRFDYLDTALNEQGVFIKLSPNLDNKPGFVLKCVFFMQGALVRA